MTDKQINKQLIKDVETAVNNVANAYNGEFKIKKSDEGTDRVSNFTLRLSSNEWNKDAQIKFSIDKLSEFVGDPNDPMYYACCDMGIALDKWAGIGFVGAKYSVDIRGRKKDSIGKFIEELFLPSAIEILKFAKANKRKYPSVIEKKLKDFFRDMWNGIVKKVPTEEQIAQLFQSDAEKKNEKKDREFTRKVDEWFFRNYEPYHTSSKQDKELKDFLKGTSDKTYLKMLNDIGLTSANNEVKNKVKEILKTNAKGFFKDQVYSLKLDSVQDSLKKMGEIKPGEKYFEVHCTTSDKKKEETLKFPKKNADEAVAAEHAYYLLKKKGWSPLEIASAKIDVELKTM